MQPLVAQDIGNVSFIDRKKKYDCGKIRDVHFYLFHPPFFFVIAEIIVFTAGRPPHVNIADMLIFPTNQASATNVARNI